MLYEKLFRQKGQFFDQDNQPDVKNWEREQATIEDILLKILASEPLFLCVE